MEETLRQGEEAMGEGARLAEEQRWVARGVSLEKTKHDLHFQTLIQERGGREKTTINVSAAESDITYL